MKKMLLLIIMVYSAFTILHFINGDDFNFYDYVISLDEINDLNRPTLDLSLDLSLPSEPYLSHYEYKDIYCSKFITFDDTSNINSNIYVYDTIVIGQFGSGEPLIFINVGKRLYYHVTKTYDDYEKCEVSIETYNSLPIEYQEKFEPVIKDTSDLSLEDYVKYFFDILLSPIVVIYRLLSFIWSLIVYLFNVILIIGGGLLV